MQVHLSTLKNNSFEKQNFYCWKCLFFLLSTFVRYLTDVKNPAPAPHPHCLPKQSIFLFVNSKNFKYLTQLALLSLTSYIHTSIHTHTQRKKPQLHSATAVSLCISYLPDVPAHMAYSVSTWNPTKKEIYSLSRFLLLEALQPPAELCLRKYVLASSLRKWIKQWGEQVITVRRFSRVLEKRLNVEPL